MEQGIQLVRYGIEQLDEESKQCLIALENTIWPKSATITYPEDASTFVAAFLLQKEKEILAHTALHSMRVLYKGSLYRMFGIKEVLVAPSLQGKGYGGRMLQECLPI